MSIMLNEICINEEMLPKYICGAFNMFPDFFVQVFKIVVDLKFSVLLLYILWDDWPISMISG